MNVILTVSKVLELIDPVAPDNLQHVGQGLYRAKWGPGVPTSGELLILTRTPRIEIIGSPYTPDGLPGWTSIDFMVSA